MSVTTSSKKGKSTRRKKFDKAEADAKAAFSITAIVANFGERFNILRLSSFYQLHSKGYTHPHELQLPSGKADNSGKRHGNATQRNRICKLIMCAFERCDFVQVEIKKCLIDFPDKNFRKNLNSNVRCRIDFFLLKFCSFLE